MKKYEMIPELKLNNRYYYTNGQYYFGIRKYILVEIIEQKSSSGYNLNFYVFEDQSCVGHSKCRAHYIFDKNNDLKFSHLEDTDQEYDSFHEKKMEVLFTEEIDALIHYYKKKVTEAKKEIDKAKRNITEQDRLIRELELKIESMISSKEK